MAGHTIYRRLTLFSLLTGSMLGGCGYDDFDGLSLPDNRFVAATTDISRLHEWYSVGEGVRHVYDDLVIAGYVTANDRGDNFYRTFFIQDATGAIEVRAGIFDLHNTFARGRRVAIVMKGLSLGEYNGVLQLGCAPAYGERYVEYIAGRYFPGSFFAPQDDWQNVEPVLIAIEGLSEEICGMLVRIDGLQSIDEQGATWMGDRVFSDAAGNEITVATSEYALFANEKIPAGPVSLTGILMKTSGGYILKIRDLDDVSEQ